MQWLSNKPPFPFLYLSLSYPVGDNLNFIVIIRPLTILKLQKIRANPDGDIGMPSTELRVIEKALIASHFLFTSVMFNRIAFLHYQEISLLHELRHPNVVLLKDCILDQNRVWLIFEYVEQVLLKKLQKCRHPI